MAAAARGDPAAAGLLPERPPIAALFLIEFDVKAGYTIVWKQAVRGVDLSGAVEYKSLPSGLHAVAEDLIYFVHEDEADDDEAGGGGASPLDDDHRGGYAGLSAFVNLPTDEAGARNARMLAVGVLVPRSYGRLGRAWRHAEALLDMARKLAADRAQLPQLEAYWLEHSRPPSTAADPDEPDHRRPPLLPLADDSPLSSPVAAAAPPSGLPSTAVGGYARTPAPLGAGHTRRHARSASDGAALQLPPGHRLSPHHPAWSLPALLDTFGPLVFPIYRAALLRKRILISTHAPVHEVNNFVYNLSVLANVPIAALDLLAPSAAARQRIRPLFTIGVNDIGFLLEDYAAAQRTARRAATAAEGSSSSSSSSHGDAAFAYSGPGWIACTTDSILALKTELWDVLITMPPARAASAASAAAAAAGGAGQPKVWPTVEVAKGVPLKATQRDLRRFKALTAGLERLAGPAAPAGAGAAAQRVADAAEAVVEPVTWAALAYSGFMWWASAGEQRRTEEADEAIEDAQLLADLVPPPPAAVAAPRQDDGDDDDDEAHGEDERAQAELAIITYFHRLTTQVLSVLADVVESGDDDDGGDDEDVDGESDDNEDDGGSGLVGDYVDDDSSSAEGGGGGGGGSASGSGSGSGDDGLVDARRSGLASSSTTALLLRRRGGGGGGGHRRLNRRGPGRGPGSSRRRRGGTARRRRLRINGDAVTRMGLDVWSAGDARFVCGAAELFFGRRGAHVEGKGLEVCGLRVC